MDINCIGVESKRDEFRKYLEQSGATEKLTTTLTKLYQESSRPEDAVGFIRHQLCDSEYPDLAEIEAMKKEIVTLTAEKETAVLELSVLKTNEAKKTNSEMLWVMQNELDALKLDEESKCLLKDYLTDGIYEQYKDLQTVQGGTLLDNIQCGLNQHDAEIGIYASDPSAYTTYGLLFDPVLEDIHDIEKEGETPTAATQPEVTWGEEADFEEFTDIDPEANYVKSISIKVGRALNDLQFMPTISDEQLQEVSDKIRKVVLNITDEEFAGKFHSLKDIEIEQKKKWVEEGVLFNEPEDRFLKAAKTYRFWPLGRALFLNDKNNIKVWVNEEEHVQICSYNEGANLREVYQRLVKFMEFFNALEFARDAHWGFVAHNLKNIGNAMQISVKVKLPQLANPDNAEKLDELKDGHCLETKDLGDGMMEITTNKCYGVTEIVAVRNFQKAIGEVIGAEKCLVS